MLSKAQLPSIAILGSTLLWGTFWIPVRELNEVGLGSVWATTGSFVIPLMVLLPFALLRLKRIMSSGLPVIIGSILVAAAIAIYAEAFLRGYVAKVMLLWYLTPIWSSLLGWLLISELITRSRIVAIVLGLAGLVVITGAESGLPLPREAGEWMALISGVLWAWGMVYLKQTASTPIMDRVFLQFVFMGIIFWLASLVPGGTEMTSIRYESLLAGLPWLFAFALIWTLPLVWLTVYGASALYPGKVAVLLLLDIVIGITSATILTDEPFGVREMCAAVLIIGASLVELFDGVQNIDPVVSQTEGVSE
jgi:drug/metabolite transporter (DMT)-like permease